jgi:hypothetical protein
VYKILPGAALTLVVQLLLIGGYLYANDQDPVILNPDRGGMVKNGIVMATYCGSQSGKGVLDNLPANGRWDTWSKGRAGRVGRASCTVSYHQHPGYTPCHPDTPSTARAATGARAETKPDVGEAQSVRELRC